MRFAAGVDHCVQTAHKLTSRSTIVDPEQQVATHVRRGAFLQRTALDVIELGERPPKSEPDRPPLVVLRLFRRIRIGSRWAYGNACVDGLLDWSTPSRTGAPRPP